MTDSDELRTLIREVIRDLMPAGVGAGTETVYLSDDRDLAAFVDRMMNLTQAEQDEIRSGQKRFVLGSSRSRSVSDGRATNAPAPPPADAGRRIEKGAVTEAMVRQAAKAGERLVLGRAAVLTPLAAERARMTGVRIEKER